MNLNECNIPGLVGSAKARTIALKEEDLKMAELASSATTILSVKNYAASRFNTGLNECRFSADTYLVARGVLTYVQRTQEGRKAEAACHK